MKPDKIAIICNGKEIAYGFSLLHLLNYKTEEHHFACDSFNDCSVDIYSLETYRRSNISKKTKSIFYGNTQEVDESYSKVFDKFGIQIYKSGLVYVVKAEYDNRKEPIYDNFFLFAIEQYKKYYSIEKEYVDKTKTFDTNWIKKEFHKDDSVGFFGKKKIRLQQLYDCAAYVIFELLRKEKGV